MKSPKEKNYIATPLEQKIVKSKYINSLWDFWGELVSCFTDVCDRFVMKSCKFPLNDRIVNSSIPRTSLASIS